jgi:hypothetical protein
MGQSYAKKHTFLNRPAEPVSAADFADSQARRFGRKMLKTANEKRQTLSLAKAQLFIEKT